MKLKQHLGETRSSYQAHHAFISPDSHERTTLPNWIETLLVFVISPKMGSAFSQYFAEMSHKGVGHPPLPGVERFVMVLSGKVNLHVANEDYRLVKEGYAMIPADTPHTITADGVTRLIVLEKEYVPYNDSKKTCLIVSKISDHETTPLKDDDRLMLQKLLPEDQTFDCEINVMDFLPGTGLPYVEIHHMEHGLLLLNGSGIYRLENCWYPADAGDIIWMGPYCTQWFGAIGRSNARYLIYKNYNRDPLGGSY